MEVGVVGCEVESDAAADDDEEEDDDVEIEDGDDNILFIQLSPLVTPRCSLPVPVLTTYTPARFSQGLRRDTLPERCWCLAA